MKIKIKNNPKSKISKAEVKEVAEYYFNELLGTKAKGLGTVDISFRKMALHHGGKAIHNYFDNRNQKVVINSQYGKHEIYRVLAHECTHVKQYFLKELTYTHLLGKRKMVAVWKGKTVLRCSYRKRAWEVEARKYESMATGIESKLKRINKTAPVKVEQKPISNIENRVLEILKDTDLQNGDFLNVVLNGNADSQYRIKVQKEIYAMKELGMIEVYYEDSIAWIRKKG